MSDHTYEKAVEQFEREGFAVLESVIPQTVLAQLREECAYFVGYTDSWMDREKLDVFGITHRGKRYFISNRYRSSQRMIDFLFGSLMKSIVGSFVGDDVYLFNEQWVVKGPEQGMKFAWHQDSGYVKFYDPNTVHKPYLTCWCALDDVSHENGTISVMPHSVVGTRNTILDHMQETGTNDLVGYSGQESGVELSMPAGSIAVFSSTSLHRSSANKTKMQRRAYLAQYSSEPIRRSRDGLWAQATPFLKDGRLIYDQASDLAEFESRPKRSRTVPRAQSRSE